MPRSETSPLVRAGLAGRRIFLTGGTGFLGRTLLDWFSTLQPDGQKAFSVTVLSRNANAFLALYPRYAGLAWLDFASGSLDDLPQASSYTDVIHAAADTHLQGQGAQWVQQIVQGTHSVLEFARRSGAQRFLLVSSGAVYGPQPADMAQLAEDFAGSPSPSLASSTYGQAKRVAEQLCTVYRCEYGMETVVARLFSFCGPHVPLNGPYAIGNFIRDAIAGRDILVKGDGSAIRSYLAGDEVAAWLAGLLVRGVAGQAYNVGSDQGVSIAELAKTVRDIVAPMARVVIENSTPVEPSARSRYVPSVQKIGTLGFSPQYSLEEIVRQTSAAIQADPRHLSMILPGAAQ